MDAGADQQHGGERDEKGGDMVHVDVVYFILLVDLFIVIRLEEVYRVDIRYLVLMPNETGLRLL